MRKALSVSGLLLLLVAPLAHAGNVSMRWNKCYGEGTGVANRSFTCDTNSGSELLVGSFIYSAPLADVVQVDAIVDLAASSASLPAWWQFTGGSVCRSTSLSADINFDPSNLACSDWADGLAPIAGMSYSAGVRSANTSRVLVSASIPVDAAPTLFAWNEYFAFNLAINHLSTSGAGSCAGCSTPMCIMLTSISLTRSSTSTPIVLSGPTNGTDANYVTWQGGGAPAVGSVTGCPAATPTRNTTWGAVKSMYR
jgi:hypothetical protein